MIRLNRAAARLALTLAACIPLAGLAAPTEEGAVFRSAPLRFMIIGDSITEGDAGGYRLPLYQKIQARIGTPNFVGLRNSRQSDPASFTDNDHEGYSAYRIDQIADGAGFWKAPPIEQRLKAWEPAVVTIHAGTNDAQQNYFFDADPARGMPSVIDRLDSLVNRIRAHNPNIYIVVAQIVPANAPASAVTQDYVRRLNALIPGLVARHQAQGHRVSLVDLYTPMLPYPHPDGIHPSQEGFQVMGETLFQALVSLGVLPKNPNPGRDDGVRQIDEWSTYAHAPWPLADNNLLRSGAGYVRSMRARNLRTDQDPTLLVDGSLDHALVPKDNAFEMAFLFDLARYPQGMDIQSLRTTAGQVTADNGDERTHQSYEVYWSSVEAPTVMKRLGDFNHPFVNRDQSSSRITLDRSSGKPLVSGAARLVIRFTEPPQRQIGFIGVGNPTRYREIEALGQPSAAR